MYICVCVLFFSFIRDSFRSVSKSRFAMKRLVSGVAFIKKNLPYSKHLHSQSECIERVPACASFHIKVTVMCGIKNSLKIYFHSWEFATSSVTISRFIDSPWVKKRIQNFLSSAYFYNGVILATNFPEKQELSIKFYELHGKSINQ